MSQDNPLVVIFSNKSSRRNQRNHMEKYGKLFYCYEIMDYVVCGTFGISDHLRRTNLTKSSNTVEILWRFIKYAGLGTEVIKKSYLHVTSSRDNEDSHGQFA